MCTGFAEAKKRSQSLSALTARTITSSSYPKPEVITVATVKITLFIQIPMKFVSVRNSMLYKSFETPENVWNFRLLFVTVCALKRVF